MAESHPTQSNLNGLDAALIVAEHLPREEDGTATIMEVAQRRDVLLSYLGEAKAERDRYREALKQIAMVLWRTEVDSEVADVVRICREALDG